ncbi:MAG: hypothetical protein JNM48_15180 [Rhodospirillales bacterium]|nr:hypothetical protein [Rhodospirillales bacterium]
MALPLYALISVIGLIILIPGSVSIRSSHLPSPPSFSASLPVVGIVLGLVTMLGKMMAESGGADQIAKALLPPSARSGCTGR